jgi:sortase A
MRWRRAIRPLAWTLVACVLLTAGWTAFMIADPFAGERQQGLQQQLYRQWRADSGQRQGSGHEQEPGHRDKHSSRPEHGHKQEADHQQEHSSHSKDASRRRDSGERERSQAATRRAPVTVADSRDAKGAPGRVGRPADSRLVTGHPFALMRIPAFGAKWKFAVVQGTSLRQLALGPGHVTGTELPGQRGNFVVAAHDITAGNPFMHLRSLRSPDRVLVTTRTHVYEYVVDSTRKVRYTDVGVELPVPGHPGSKPGRALITLITCTPVTLDFTPWRIVVTGHLVKTSPRHAG